MRCARCGNDNPGTNRFCGMCGATLFQDSTGAAPVERSPLKPPARVTAVPPVPPPAEAQSAPRQAAPQQQQEVPAISGPSFLGLGDPAPASRRRGSLSIDPNAAPGSRNLDYLLDDDDDGPKSGGAGKFLLIVVALLLAGGFGYLRWKNQGLPWLGSGAAKPSATAPGADTPDSNSTAAPSSASPPSTSSAPAQPSTTPSGAPSTTNPPANSGASNPGQSGSTQPDSSQASSSPSSSSQPSSTPPTSAQPGAKQSSPAPAGANASPDSGDDTDSDSAKPTESAANRAATPAPADVAPATKPKAASAAPVSRPVSQPRPVVPRTDPVSEARKYLYGRSVPQDCERGLRLLKPSAEQANPKAMAEMGALYSAGLCTPRDLPTAYRWFALALRKDPENQPLQGDLQKLWGEMTQPERQLAIKLTQ